MQRRARILVVEDNEMNKVLVREILTLHGYEVIEAISGQEALEMISTHRPDIVLMDLNLPEMDGITATKIIKSDEESKNIPVIALTASAMKGDEERVLKEGFDGYVPKPIEMKKLLDSVSRGLDSSVQKKTDE